MIPCEKRTCMENHLTQVKKHISRNKKKRFQTFLFGEKKQQIILLFRNILNIKTEQGIHGTTKRILCM